MQLKLTEDYLLLIDETADAQKGKYGYLEGNIGIWYEIPPTGLLLHMTNGEMRLGNDGVIVAYYPTNQLAAELNLPLLPDPETPYKNRAYSMYARSVPNEAVVLRHFLAGYDSRLKGFSFEDMLDAIDFGKLLAQQSQENKTRTFYARQFVLDVRMRHMPKGFFPTMNGDDYTTKEVNGKTELVGTYSI